MGKGDKDKEPSKEGTMERALGSTHEARHAACDKSRECQAEIAEVVASEINKTTAMMMAQFMAHSPLQPPGSLLCHPLTGLGTRLSTSNGNHGL